MECIDQRVAFDPWYISRVLNTQRIFSDFPFNEELVLGNILRTVDYANLYFYNTTRTQIEIQLKIRNGA